MDDLKRLLKPTIDYSSIITLLNDKLKAYNMRIIQINKRKSEQSASIIYDLDLAEKYFQNEFFRQGIIRMTYENIPSGIYTVEGVFGPKINQFYSESMNVPLYPRFFHAIHLKDCKMIFNFEYISESTITPIIQIRPMIHGIIKLISNYILEKLSHVIKSLDNYLVNLESISSPMEDITYISKELLNFYNSLDTTSIKIKKLSLMQQKILWLTFRGKTLKYISSELEISENTATSYMNVIKDKLNLNSKNDIIDFIQKNPFILEPDNMRKILFGGI
ncbi:LuxR C-terminal-related transcriptional regulator [Thiotrichales bacterium 19X7-9]|nr:LuxR C-terminal-related transcriptional regulator [Thiotrichales bacterium 19X7-9]